MSTIIFLMLITGPFDPTLQFIGTIWYIYRCVVYWCGLGHENRIEKLEKEIEI